MLLGPKTTGTLRQVTISQAADGDTSETTSDIATLKGVFQPVAASEETLFQQDNVRALFHYRVAYKDVRESIRAQVTESNRLVIGSTVYNVTGAENYFNHHYLFTLEYIKPGT